MLLKALAVLIMLSIPTTLSAQDIPPNLSLGDFVYDQKCDRLAGNELARCVRDNLKQLIQALNGNVFIVNIEATDKKKCLRKGGIPASFTPTLEHCDAASSPHDYHSWQIKRRTK